MSWVDEGDFRSFELEGPHNNSDNKNEEFRESHDYMY